MRWTEALQGVRVIKFRSVLGRYKSTELNQIEAAELLGITERTFRRWCVRFEADGEAGLLDRRLGKTSPKRVSRDSKNKAMEWVCGRVMGFTTHSPYSSDTTSQDTTFTSPSIERIFDWIYSGTNATNGTERNGTEWNATRMELFDWNGMEWNGMEWNGMECNVMEWNGINQYHLCTHPSPPPTHTTYSLPTAYPPPPLAFPKPTHHYPPTA